MRLELWKRLGAIDKELAPANRIICVIQYLDETDDDALLKVEQWRSGKHVPDITTHKTEGEEIVIQVRRFSRKSDGSKVSQEEYEQWLDGGTPQEAIRTDQDLETVAALDGTEDA